MYMKGGGGGKTLVAWPRQARGASSSRICTCMTEAAHRDWPAAKKSAGHGLPRHFDGYKCDSLRLSP